MDFVMKPDWAGMWEKGIKEAWADDMVIKHGSVIKAWDSYATEYDEDEIKYSNRVSLVNRFTGHQPESVLDVGGGTGVFTLPLARLIKKVTVVEPSAGMLDVLQRKAREEGLNNIYTLCKRWEDASKEDLLKINQEKFDLVLCSHSLYYITDLHNSLRKMNDLAKGFVYLFTDCSGYSRDKDYARLYLRLHKKPLPVYPGYECLYMVLREIGIEPNLEMIDTWVKKPLKSIEEIIERWKNTWV